MKHLPKQVLVFLLGLLFQISFVSAQSTSCPPTVPDFPSIPWQYGGCYTTNLVVNGVACPVEICYCYRSLSPTQKDYYLKSVKSLSANCFGTPGMIPQGQIADIIYAASDKLAQDNPQFECPLCGSGIVTSFRMVKSSCWKQEVAGDTPPYALLVTRCADDGFCTRQYTMCCDGAGNKTITYIGDPFITGDVICPYYGTGCYTIDCK